MPAMQRVVGRMVEDAIPVALAIFTPFLHLGA